LYREINITVTLLTHDFTVSSRTQYVTLNGLMVAENL